MASNINFNSYILEFSSLRRFDIAIIISIIIDRTFLNRNSIRKTTRIIVSAISDYEIFARVVNAGNMSAAGRAMGLSPAVISKRISHLEKRLGSRLFQRTTRQLTLTETGEGFYHRVVHILDGIEEAEAFVAGRNSAPRGTLKISAPTSFSRMHIAPYLGEFLANYPELSVELDISDGFVDIVRSGYDAAIRIGELEDSSLVAKRLAPNHRVLCATPEYLEKAGEPLTLSDLTNHKCLTYIPQESWRLSGPEGMVNMKIDGTIRTNSSEVVRTAVLSNLGIALRSTWDVGPELKTGALRHILKQYRGSSGVAIYAVYPCREFLPAKLKVFLNFFSGKFGSNPYWNKGLDLSTKKIEAVG